MLLWYRDVRVRDTAKAEAAVSVPMSKRLIFRSLGARKLGPNHLLRRADGLVNGLGEVLDVVGVETCH